jgi:DNA-binding MarR family transcriptional regulator
MALKGDLKDFTTTQLLNLVSLAHKTGTVIFGPTQQGEPNRALMAFRDGKLMMAAIGDQNHYLVNVLNRTGKLSDEQARMIKERSGGASDKAIGLRLMSGGYVTREDILQSIQQYMRDVIFELVTWKEGPFFFVEDKLPGDDRIMIPLDLESIIIKIAREKVESEHLERELPNLDFGLQFVDEPSKKLKGVQLNVDEWRVVSYINPKNSIRQIAKQNDMTDLEIRRIIYGLLQAGLIELVRPQQDRSQAARKSSRRRAASTESTEAKVNVVNRLIERIRSL